MNKILTTSAAVALAAAGTYSFITWRSICLVDARSIIATENAPETFKQSKSVKSIANPKGHFSHYDTRTVTIRVPRDTTDEVILARFVKGFFGGYVLAPEGLVLGTLRKKIVNHSVLKKHPTPSQIWSQSEISDKKLPPLYSILFGAFQVIDRSIASERNNEEQSKTESYVDFAFGSDVGSLAGLHRFSVRRDWGKDGDVANIEYSCMACNPSLNAPLNPILMRFHLMYAMLLFKDAVSNVVRG